MSAPSKISLSEELSVRWVVGGDIDQATQKNRIRTVGLETCGTTESHQPFILFEPELSLLACRVVVGRHARERATQ